jgi:hypothetical protein
LLAGGESDPKAVVPGNSADSLLMRLVAGKIAEREMPPLLVRDKFPPLSPAEIELLSRWIDQGAEWPEHTGVSAEAPKQ